MTIVPAIDIMDGKCVRLTKGDYSTGKTYSDNPLEMARRFQDAGLKRLHLVDLDGARSSHTVNLKVLETIAAGTSLTIDFGGGVKADADIAAVFNAGAAMVTVGSTAVSHPELMDSWIARYGTDRLILGADARNGIISVSGWNTDSGIQLEDFIASYRAKGINRVLCTDINRDGMLQGPATALYQRLLQQFPGLVLTASGGVSCLDDLIGLRQAGLPEAIVGKAYYEGRISLDDMAATNGQQQI